MGRSKAPELSFKRRSLASTRRSRRSRSRVSARSRSASPTSNERNSSQFRRRQSMKKVCTLLFLFLAMPIAALAQRAVTDGDVIETTAEIVAIDKDARVVTLEDEDGEIEDVVCGPEVKRFDELKVGDKVTFRYY